jgi:hypothetical protein
LGVAVASFATGQLDAWRSFSFFYEILEKLCIIALHQTTEQGDLEPED